MDMEEANAATAQGDLADVVTRANAMAAVASTYHHQRPPAPAAAAAAHMPPHYPSQIMIPCEEERRPMSIMCGDAVMIEAPSTVDPYLSSATALRAGYGLQQQLAVQISQHACCGRDVLMGGAAPADDVDDAMRISPLTPAAHHQMIKRKNEVKKVVCIPAPPAMSGRAGGGEVIPSDLWAWRKYGQKPIKGSPYPRGYYRCSSSKGCMARKQVERSRSDPNMLVITYTAEHNHPWPMQRNVLAGYARAHTHASTKNKQHKIDRTDITSSSSSNNIHKYSASEQNAVGGELDGLAAAGNGVSTFDALGSGEGGVMYEACNGIQPDEVFAELEELEPGNSMNINANIYSRGVSYDQWHNKF